MFPVLDVLKNGTRLIRDLDTGKIVNDFTGVVSGKSANQFYFASASKGRVSNVSALRAWSFGMAKAEAKSRRLSSLIMASERIPFDEAMTIIGTRDADWPRSVIRRAWSHRHSKSASRKIAS